MKSKKKPAPPWHGTQQVAFRADVDLVQRLDSYAIYMREQMPGFYANRSDAIKRLLEMGLELHAKRPMRKLKGGVKAVG